MNKFKEVSKEISERLSNLPYDNGDSSDIGNEIGIVISQYLSDNSFGWELDDFIMGIKHGIDLKKNQEFYLTEIIKSDEELGLYEEPNKFDIDEKND
jgi:hypothetical protein